MRDVLRFDSSSYSFRYPINTKGKGSVSHHFVFNVLEFAGQVEGAIRLLDGAAEDLEAEWDRQASRAYAKQEVGRHRRTPCS